MTKLHYEVKENNRAFFVFTSDLVKPGQPPGRGPLGNITSYSAHSNNQDVKISDTELSKLKYDYKRKNIERKKKIGRTVKRVESCGCRPIAKRQFIDAVEGEKGKIFYNGMQRCGNVWLCPDCMYKLMKCRADELYEQLRAYKDKEKTVLFTTFTIQHHAGQSLESLHKILTESFNWANSHKTWINTKASVPVEYLRTLEVLYGENGWHPHFHSVFIGSSGIIKTIEVFINLYCKALMKNGLLVNDHTVTVEKWNGKIDSMTDYLFKGMLEQEMTGGNLKKTNKGKTFFELVDQGHDLLVNEFILTMKGKRQYHHSKKFFEDVSTKSDEEILKDDKVKKVLFSIPVNTFQDIRSKGIALHLLNEYEHGGISKAMRLLELYDCDDSFFVIKKEEQRPIDLIKFINQNHVSRK